MCKLQTSLLQMCIRVDRTANTCYTVAETAHAKTNFVCFLHEHKGNVVHSVDVFLVLNLCLRTVHLISVFKKYSTVTHVFSSLKMEWSKKEQLALIEMHSGFQFYGINCKLYAWVELEKTRLCERMKTMVCRIFVPCLQKISLPCTKDVPCANSSVHTWHAREYPFNSQTK